MNSVNKVNNLNKSDFISIFGNVFEKSEWIAVQAYALKPFNNFEELFSKMMEIFENSEKENHLEILNAHPDLVIEKKLTDDSKKEQNSANLNQCSEEEFKEFKELNERYKKKFGFPFIIAVKGKNRQEILVNFRKRIINTIDLELEETKQQVKKIATFRLREIIK